jgi:hypothetical protein
MRGRLELIYAPQNPPPTDEISAKFKMGEPVLAKDLWSGKKSDWRETSNSDSVATSTPSK